MGALRRARHGARADRARRGLRSPEPLARPNQGHHITGQVLSDKADLIADGRLALEYQDNEPVTTADTTGIIAWGEGEFDNLRSCAGH